MTRRFPDAYAKDPPPIYDLVAVANHRGGVDGGHYYTYHCLRKCISVYFNTKKIRQIRQWYVVQIRRQRSQRDKRCATCFGICVHVILRKTKTETMKGEYKYNYNFVQMYKTNKQNICKPKQTELQCNRLKKGFALLLCKYFGANSKLLHGNKQEIKLLIFATVHHL